jgi:hypothetical protein
VTQGLPAPALRARQRAAQVTFGRLERRPARRRHIKNEISSQQVARA